MLARSKLSSIESKISAAPVNNEIGLEDLMTIINKKRNCWELKEIIRMMKSQRSDTEKINLMKKVEK